MTPIDRSDVSDGRRPRPLKTPMAELVSDQVISIWMSGFESLQDRVLKRGCPFWRSIKAGWETTQSISIEWTRVRRRSRAALNLEWIMSHAISTRTGSLAIPRFPWKPAHVPRGFRYRLTERAARRETDHPSRGRWPRTIRAAALCAQRNIARCVLLEIRRRFKESRLALKIELPKTSKSLIRLLLRANYVNLLVESA